VGRCNPKSLTPAHISTHVNHSRREKLIRDRIIILECGNETSGHKKFRRNYLTSLKQTNISRRTILHAVSWNISKKIIVTEYEIDHNITTKQYASISVFSFPILPLPLQHAPSDRHFLRRHNLFGRFDDVITEFDCTLSRTTNCPQATG
jgi:hypothetical protein